MSSCERTDTSFGTTLSSSSSSDNQRSAQPSAPGVVRRADRWVREHSLLLLLLTMISAFSWPNIAEKVFARGAVLHVPMTAWTYDVQSLVLTVIVFATAIRCTPRDFLRVFGSKGGAGILVSIYLLVPAIALAIAFGLLRIANTAELKSVAFGLALLVVVPVSTTSALWTRSSQGKVSLSLGMIAITSLVAIFLVPPVLGRLAGVGGLEIASSLERIRLQVVFAFAVPLVLGTLIRAILPKVAAFLEPLVSLVAMVMLLGFVGDIVAALRPHIIVNTDLLAIAVPFTVLANVLAFSMGAIVSRMHRLDESERVALVFGSGMRSTLTAMVLAAICFPGNPIVALAPIVWTLSQQIIAGYLTRRFLHVRDSAEPVLPLKRRVSDIAARAASVSRPALAEIEEILEDTLTIRPRRAAPSRPG
jgi:bile acid:Na+ symporter, BASS family